MYRSNKLMYDAATKSLWSTLHGEPVVGELVGQQIALERSYVVTSTWGEWRRRYPNTRVLSSDTGFTRDYGEGIAYQKYFSTHELMFSVPHLDGRLQNKDEILALRDEDQQLAISAEFLQRNSVFHGSISEKKFVVLTDRSGANRVYASGEHSFVNWDQDVQATDTLGNVWRVTSDALIHKAIRLERLPAHRAFWFGWYSQFPETRLIQSN